MDLSAILNAPPAPYEQSLSPTSEFSSNGRTTPRTPMDTSPDASCSSNSPTDRRSLKAGDEMTLRAGEVESGRRQPAQHQRGQSEAGTYRLSGHPPEHWPTPRLIDTSGFANSPWTLSQGRPRRQTYASDAHSQLSPYAERAQDQLGWPDSLMRAVGQSSPSSGFHSMNNRRTDRRLPSVHELFSESAPPPSPYSQRGPAYSFSSTHEPSYDTDATISDAQSPTGSYSPDPSSAGPSPSSPISPTGGPPSSHSSRSSAFSPPVHAIPAKMFSAESSLAISHKPKCAFVEDCNLLAPPRRIVSHYFGRNKKETRAIPEDVWVFYCRQHYQRVKYNQRTHVYAQTQMRLVRQTVENLEHWGGVLDFAINLRKRAVQQLRKEDERTGSSGRGGGEGGRGSSGVRGGHEADDASGGGANDERWLLPFTGPHKSFADVYDVIARVAERSRLRQCPAAEFELVPNIRADLMRRGSRATAGRRERDEVR